MATGKFCPSRKLDLKKIGLLLLLLMMMMILLLLSLLLLLLHCLNMVFGSGTKKGWKHERVCNTGKKNRELLIHDCSGRSKDEGQK